MRRTHEDGGGSTKQIGSGTLEGILPFRILVVDDDEDTLMALRDRLLSMGFDVVIEIMATPPCLVLPWRLAERRFRDCCLICRC